MAAHLDALKPCNELPHRFPILTLQASVVSLPEATQLVVGWAKAGESRSVCAANVHMVMETYGDPSFAQVVNGADLIVPDGMPLAWCLRWFGNQDQRRVCGPDLMLEICRLAADQQIPVGLYGSRPSVIEALQRNLLARFPALQISYAFSPPFRPLSEEEESAVVHSIQASQARILFVGLGCPRQERWMDRHRSSLNSTLLGVGAAFDFHAGILRIAPAWMKNSGLEWLFRLLSEPRRLWKRYLKHNSTFLFLIFCRAITNKLTQNHN